MELDHIAVSGATLEEATEHVESSLGVKLQFGGTHQHYGTHNRLLHLADGIYLEAIAIDKNLQRPPFPRWFNLDNFKGPPRITNWICRSRNIKKDLAELSINDTKIVQLQRNHLRWLMYSPTNGMLPFDGTFPALLQWQTSPHPVENMLNSGCRLKHMTIYHPEISKIQEKMRFFSDPRISFRTYASFGFFADFETPHGTRSLE